MKNNLTPFQRFLRLLQLDRKDIRQIIFYAIFAGVVNLSLPLGIQAIINMIQGAQISSSYVVLVILVTIGVAFAGILQLMQIRISENIQQKIFTRASFEFAYRFPKMKMSELRQYYPPELANRFFDTLNVQKGLSKVIIDFPSALLQILFGLAILSFYHPFFIIYGLLLLVLIYVVFKYTAKKGLDTSLIESKYKYKVAHWLQEIARSVISFKLSGRTSLAMQKNDDLVSGYLKARESHFKVLVLQFTQLIGFKVLVTAGLLLIGGLLVLNQQMNIGQFVAAEIIILLVISSVEKLLLGLETFYDVLTSLEKIGQVSDKDLENLTGTVLSDQEPLKVELSQFTYAVPDRPDPILNNINVLVESKDVVLVEGNNNSGKSTLLKALAAILEPTSGQLYINDLAFSGIKISSYRAMVGQVLSDETPFEGSILHNLTFGDPNIPLTKVNEVVKVLGLTNFIKEQPAGLYTIIYPEGKRISNTNIKKLLLARAILKRPRLLLLKDPLEYFNTTEAQQIIDYLVQPNHTWAIVIVSQNNIWKKHCNKIITLSNGHII
ncbi:peptidase domain-containing ABC transporter [Aurantibacter aestuarii]|uniref:ABC transporter ATP-binding protein/permease n=1 Tax=Aurantibacter aestuarii TaxID=1266046 RepID=A0A2T1N8G6_9FLAO|nr:ATP-binding cassette domain-containing protein [Aurantibacter aestuarii]PSG88160.1 ABC transporter ATP-binding protein/permease [Aurantibacter aestuarii]